METGFSLKRYEACFYLPLVHSIATLISLITKLLKMIAYQKFKV